ncbi:MAG: hypothetical protein ACTS4U_00915 [Candidatus Hodgkinia cicadicola]
MLGRTLRVSIWPFEGEGRLPLSLSGVPPSRGLWFSSSRALPKFMIRWGHNW